MYTLKRITAGISFAAVMVAGILACGQTWAADDEQAACKGLDPKQQNMSCYLADFSAGQVSASSIVGVAPSAIQNIQTAQDIVVAIKPFSSSDSKSGFGIAITPARTAFFPMSGRDYYGNDFYRLIGQLTFSYAENNADVKSVSYVKRGGSIDTMFYLDRDSDPIIQAYNNWKTCPEEKKAFDGYVNSLGTAQEGAAKANLNAVRAKCFKAPWNASRISVSLGHGAISAPGGARYSLGTSVAITGNFALGKNAEIQVFYRKTINEIMIDTVATGATFRDSSLGALRLTVAGAEAGRLQALLEVSNAKRNSGVQSDAVFKYAVGFDLRIHPGVWLEFRYGRGRTLSNASLENRGMVSLNLSPTCALLQKCVGG